MKTDLNPNFVRWLVFMLFRAIILGGAAFAVFSIMTGCNAAKQSARKDKAALERVTAKRALIDSVAPIVFGLYPCANDTVTTFLSGGVDSVPYPVPVMDEGAKKRIIDSVKTVFADNCDAAVEASYEAGYNNAMIDMKTQKVPVKRPDTLVNSIVDRQKHNQYEKTIASLREKNAAQEAISQQLENTAKELKAEKASWIWYFIAAVAACVLTNGIWIYSKFKNPLK